MFASLRRPLTTVSRSHLNRRSVAYFTLQYVKWGFNRYSKKKVEQHGPDRAAAEWLLRCAASFRPKGHKDFVSTKKQLKQLPTPFFIESIDATDSAMHAQGFDYLDGLAHLKELRLNHCSWIENQAISKVAVYCQSSLERFELVSCANVTATGLLALQTLKKLKVLYLCALPLVTNQDRVVLLAQLACTLPRGCKVSFPDLKTFDDMDNLRPK